MPGAHCVGHTAQFNQAACPGLQRIFIMEILTMVLAALLLITGALYAQGQIPRYTRGSGRIMLTRALLIIVGIAFGWLGTYEVAGRVPQVLAFLIGFGLVHLPAAVILFIKSRRGAGKS
jgi:hypothetical protein